MHNAIPVFCDVDPETFCIDPDKVESLVSKQTKAIVPVHLLGHPADMPKIMAIAEKYGIHVVEDSAQALGASINGIRTGNFGHMGVFSFQETKNLPVGEGGMVTTSDERLAERVRMIRNHGESILLGKSREYISNIIGWNYRMTEMEAALGRSQLKKVVRFDAIRKELFEYLLKHLDGFPGIQVPIIKPGFIHGYHIFGMIYNASSTGVSRERLIEALQAEGVPVGGGYRRPLYDNPIFKDLKGYGDQGCPFRCGFYKGSIDYNDPQCPVAEALVSENALWLYVVRPPATIADMDDIVGGFKKVWSSMDRLCDSDE
jgi:dTDP-4-amino-4,6-dideoxygalactose transaminase